uniref:Uncharacterized protein n=1 Tax=Timema monikensis TaxID=170555 RepID=A0A7R9E7U4_9NEOP|nr:unnamed protein product [Timema monikensis]
MGENVKNSPLTTNTEPELYSHIGYAQKLELKMEMDNDRQIKLEPSFAGEEEINIDAKPLEDSKECINEKLQNNDLTIINFLPIKEEGSKEYINENKQNNELKISPTISFPPIKEEIKNEPTHTIHYLPSQANYVASAWDYLNLEKCLISKRDKDFNEPTHESLKKMIFFDESALEENNTECHQDRSKQLFNHSGQRIYKCDACDRFKDKIIRILKGTDNFIMAKENTSVIFVILSSKIRGILTDIC